MKCLQSILQKFYYARNYWICRTYSSKFLGFPIFPHSFFNIVFLLFEIVASDRFNKIAIKDIEKPNLISKQIR